MIKKRKSLAITERIVSNLRKTLDKQHSHDRMKRNQSATDKRYIISNTNEQRAAESDTYSATKANFWNSVDRQRAHKNYPPFKMLDIFRGLKNLVKVNHITTDSPVFRLHYSITVMVLMSFSLIVTTRQYVGNPIDCVHTKDLPEDVLNTYCWIHSTYTLKSLFRKKVGSEVPYPGIGNSEGKMHDRKSYKYYQWVCFCLFFQVISPSSKVKEWKFEEEKKKTHSVRLIVSNVSVYMGVVDVLWRCV